MCVALQGLRDVPKGLPKQLKPLYSAVAAFAAPTLIVQTALFLKKLQPHRRRRLRRSITESGESGCVPYNETDPVLTSNQGIKYPLLLVVLAI